MSDTVKTILDLAAVIIAALGGLGGLAALLMVRTDRRKKASEILKEKAETKEIEEKTPATVAETVVGASGEALDQYQKLFGEYRDYMDGRINDMEKEIAGLRAMFARRIAYLLNGIQMLTEQIVGLGHEPCWSPNKSELDLPAEDPEPKKGS